MSYASVDVSPSGIREGWNPNMAARASGTTNLCIVSRRPDSKKIRVPPPHVSRRKWPRDGSRLSDFPKMPTVCNDNLIIITGRSLRDEAKARASGKDYEDL